MHVLGEAALDVASAVEVELQVGHGGLEIVMTQAEEKRCPIILLTDTLGSIIGGKAEVVLAAKRGPVSAFHSQVVPMTIINTLLLEIANQNQETVISNLDNLDQLRERLKNLGG